VKTEEREKKKDKTCEKREGKSEEVKEVYETGRKRVDRTKKECENGRKEDKRCVKKEVKREEGKKV
jgi:hypothetical protein